MKGLLLNRNEIVINLQPRVLQTMLARLEEVSQVTYGTEVIALRIMGEGDVFDYEITAKYTATGSSY